jgi:hypothetical protein
MIHVMTMLKQRGNDRLNVCIHHCHPMLSLLWTKLFDWIGRIIAIHTMGHVAKVLRLGPSANQFFCVPSVFDDYLCLHMSYVDGLIVIGAA